MNNSIIYKRISAYLLDIIFVYLLISSIISIRFLNPTYDKYVEVTNNYNDVLTKYYDQAINAQEMVELNKDNLYYLTKYSISTNIIVIIVIIGYFGLFQKYNHGQTLGKKITKIKLVGLNNEEVSLGKSLLRILFVYYIFVGNVLAVLLNIIAVYIFNSNNFIYVNSIITYIFLGMGIISLVMTFVNKENQGLHDKLIKTKVINI